MKITEGSETLEIGITRTWEYSLLDDEMMQVAASLGASLFLEAQEDDDGDGGFLIRSWLDVYQILVDEFGEHIFTPVQRVRLEDLEDDERREINHSANDSSAWFSVATALCEYYNRKYPGINMACSDMSWDTGWTADQCKAMAQEAVSYLHIGGSDP
jgi:hypothetical protein